MDTAYALLIIQGLTGIIVVLVGWVVKEIRNDGKETLNRVREINGRLGKVEEWKEIHIREDNRAHENIDKLWDAVERLKDR